MKTKVLSLKNQLEIRLRERIKEFHTNNQTYYRDDPHIQLLLKMIKKIKTYCYL